jgi:hypothetical protein
LFDLIPNILPKDEIPDLIFVFGGVPDIGGLPGLAVPAVEDWFDELVSVLVIVTAENPEDDGVPSWAESGNGEDADGPRRPGRSLMLGSATGFVPETLFFRA